MRFHRRLSPTSLIGLAVLLLAVDGCILVFRALGFPRDVAIYAGLLSFTALCFLAFRHWRKFSEESPMMNKRSLFPPARDAQKREASVTLRFQADDFERLRRVAQFSESTVANLLHYVTLNTMLPLLEREMQREQAESGKPVQSTAEPAPLPAPKAEGSTGTERA